MRPGISRLQRERGFKGWSPPPLLLPPPPQEVMGMGLPLAVSLVVTRVACRQARAACGRGGDRDKHRDRSSRGLSTGYPETYGPAIGSSRTLALLTAGDRVTSGPEIYSHARHPCPVTYGSPNTDIYVCGYYAPAELLVPCSPPRRHLTSWVSYWHRN